MKFFDKLFSVGVADDLIVYRGFAQGENPSNGLLA